MLDVSRIGVGLALLCTLTADAELKNGTSFGLGRWLDVIQSLNLGPEDLWTTGPAR